MAGDSASAIRAGHFLGGDRPGAENPIGCAGSQVVGRLLPVAHRHDQQRRSLGRLCLVVCPRNRPRHVLGTEWQVGPHRVLARESVEVTAGQEGLKRHLAAILLPDHHDEGRAGIARVGNRVDGVAEARRGVQVDECRFAACDGVTGRHPHH
jgi:hypothetical protein